MLRQGLKRNRGQIEGIGPSVVRDSVEMLPALPRQSPRLGQNGGARPDALHLLRACRDASGRLPPRKTVGAAVALVHDAIARESGHNLQIQPHAGLPLRHMPWADRAALGAAKTNVRADIDGSGRGMTACRAPGAQSGARRIKAVHAATRDVQSQRLSLPWNADALNEESVVGRQAVDHITPLGPVLVADARRKQLRQRFARFRIPQGVTLATGLHACAAAYAFLQIQQSGVYGFRSDGSLRRRQLRRGSGGHARRPRSKKKKTSRRLHDAPLSASR